VRAVLIEDAHTTVDTPDLHAREIIAHRNRTLNGPFVASAQSAAYEF
jgi:hypothetical protein